MSFREKHVILSEAKDLLFLARHAALPFTC